MSSSATPLPPNVEVDDASVLAPEPGAFAGSCTRAPPTALAASEERAPGSALFVQGPGNIAHDTRVRGCGARAGREVRVVVVAAAHWLMAGAARRIFGGPIRPDIVHTVMRWKLRRMHTGTNRTKRYNDIRSAAACHSVCGWGCQSRQARDAVIPTSQWLDAQNLPAEGYGQRAPRPHSGQHLQGRRQGARPCRARPDVHHSAKGCVACGSRREVDVCACTGCTVGR